jgi:hypothetical protein
MSLKRAGVDFFVDSRQALVDCADQHFTTADESFDAADAEMNATLIHLDSILTDLQR